MTAENTMEERTTQPFLIRGHHLPQFARLKYWYLEQLAKHYLPKTQEPVDDKFQHWYLNDVFGSSLDPGPFLSHTIEQYQKFLKLEPDDPVHIVVGQVDEICKGCAIGEHCKLKYPTGIAGELHDIVRGEEKWLEGLLFALGVEGIELPTIIGDTVTFPDSPQPENVRRVITNARTTRRALNSFFFSPKSPNP